jgi:non-homologous end joining protein Ku
VLALLEEKRKSEEITIAPAPKSHPAPVIDIMQALKQSMERVPAQRKVAAGEKRRKKVS